jgi:hypothetical protein
MISSRVSALPVSVMTMIYLPTVINSDRIAVKIPSQIFNSGDSQRIQAMVSPFRWHHAIFGNNPERSSTSLGLPRYGIDAVSR